VVHARPTTPDCGGASLYDIVASRDATTPPLTVADCLDPQTVRRTLMALAEFTRHSSTVPSMSRRRCG
jgi:hypothetical protein